jgi:hypothetical protein
VHGKLVRAMTRLLERAESLRRRKCQRYIHPSRAEEDARTLNGERDHVFIGNQREQLQKEPAQDARTLSADHQRGQHRAEEDSRPINGDNMTPEHTSLAPPAAPLWADVTGSKRRAARPDHAQRVLAVASMASPPTAAGVHASQNASHHVSHRVSQGGALGSRASTQTKTASDHAAPGGGDGATFTTGNPTATSHVAGGKGMGIGLVSTPPAARRVAWQVWPRVAPGNTSAARPRSSSSALSQ